MPHLAVIAATLVLVTCGGYKLFARPFTKTQNTIYQAAWIPLHKESGGLKKEIEQGLFSLHSYYILGRINLLRLDKHLKENDTFIPHNTYPYLNLLAVRLQLEKIEKEFLERSQKLPSSELNVLKKQIYTFALKSNLHSQSVNNIAKGLQLEINFQNNIHEHEILKEYQNLTQHLAFKTFEKNVEHISQLHRTKPKDDSRSPASFNPKTSQMGWSAIIRLDNQPNEFSPSQIDALDWPAQSPDMIVNRIKLMVKKSKQESGTIVFHDKQIQEEYLKNIKVN